MPENEIATFEQGPVPTVGLELPKTYVEVFQMAETVAKSQIIPQCFRGKPADCAIGMMWAIEAGINPITGLAFIGVINGKAGWHSDAVPGLAKRKKLIDGYEEWFEGEFPNDDFKAVCKVFGADGREYVNEFSVGDAKTAGIWQKNVHKTYPKRMLQWRARSWAIRDAAPDNFFGPTYEELLDTNSQHRGPDRAKPINVDTTAAPRKIVTMTTEVEAAADAQAETQPPGQESTPADDQPKRSIKDIVMELANADSLEQVSVFESMLNEKRDGMKEGHVTAIERAIAEARSRLTASDNNADAYAERIMEGGDPGEIKAEIDADDSLSPGDRNTLLTMIADHAGASAV